MNLKSELIRLGISILKKIEREPATMATILKDYVPRVKRLSLGSIEGSSRSQRTARIAAKTTRTRSSNMNLC